MEWVKLKLKYRYSETCCGNNVKSVQFHTYIVCLFDKGHLHLSAPHHRLVLLVLQLVLQLVLLLVLQLVLLLVLQLVLLLVLFFLVLYPVLLVLLLDWRPLFGDEELVLGLGCLVDQRLLININSK